MKKILVLIMLLSFMVGCSSSEDFCYKEKNGKKICKTFEPYGILDKDDIKDEHINYEVSVGGVVVSVLLVSTVIIPGYVVLFDIMEPVGVKKDYIIKTEGVKK